MLFRSRDRSGAYRYLPRSVDTFLSPEGVAQAAGIQRPLHVAVEEEAHRIARTLVAEEQVLEGGERPDVGHRRGIVLPGGYGDLGGVPAVARGRRDRSSAGGSGV